jgi:hypothetical protein
MMDPGFWESEHEHAVLGTPEALFLVMLNGDERGHGAACASDPMRLRNISSGRNAGDGAGRHQRDLSLHHHNL